MTPADKHGAPLLGVAALARRAFAGEDLTTIALGLIARSDADPTDANAKLDLATVFLLKANPEFALSLLDAALGIQRLYHLPAAMAGGPDVLVLMTPGDLMTNAPLPFLVEGSDVSLHLLYVTPDIPLPSPLPAHDLVFNAIGESSGTQEILDMLKRELTGWPRPVLNRPELIAATAREHAHQVLSDLCGVVMPPSLRLPRAMLEAVSLGAALPGALTDGFPLIIRPLDSHAGRALEKLDGPQDLATYLSALPDAEFHVSPFIDYRSDDGRFRKYRVVLIDGEPFPVHMGISDHWMIHYLNAGMAESEAKRAEEARWMEGFVTDFAVRHGQALHGIAGRLALDYLVIDCGETSDGRLLLFEIDTGAIVHDMDPVDVYPYKGPQMRRLFQAFRQMLWRARERGQPSP